MTKASDDTEVVLDRFEDMTQPPSIDPATLRRAMRYGQNAATKFRDQDFNTMESELRAGWILKGELAEWDWVRDAVRLGFEQSSPDAE